MRFLRFPSVDCSANERAGLKVFVRKFRLRFLFFYQFRLSPQLAQTDSDWRSHRKLALVLLTTLRRIPQGESNSCHYESKFGGKVGGATERQQQGRGLLLLAGSTQGLYKIPFEVFTGPKQLLSLFRNPLNNLNLSPRQRAD